ncbi:MAG: hypothetical protein ABI831_19920 [Betaproteobacteria bacterium]
MTVSVFINAKYQIVSDLTRPELHKHAYLRTPQAVYALMQNASLTRARHPPILGVGRLKSLSFAIKRRRFILFYVPAIYSKLLSDIGQQLRLGAEVGQMFGIVLLPMRQRERLADTVARQPFPTRAVGTLDTHRGVASRESTWNRALLFLLIGSCPQQTSKMPLGAGRCNVQQAPLIEY